MLPIETPKAVQNLCETFYRAMEPGEIEPLLLNESTNDNTPLVKYLLGIILAAYRDFEERLNLINDKISAIQAVENVIKNRIGKFTKSDIQEKCPALAHQTIEKALKKLCDNDMIEKKGSGRTNYYVRKNL